jgi:hypothetical protein
MKVAKQIHTHLDVNLSTEEYKSMVTTIKTIEQFAEACNGAKEVKSEWGDVIQLAELNRVRGILDTLVRCIGYEAYESE